MEIVFYISCAIFGLSMGYFIAKTAMRNSCKHKWELLLEGTIGREKRTVGFVKVYECEHCKKMKTERVNYTKD
jgi:hypothetical protein